MRNLLPAIFLILSACSQNQSVDVFPQAKEVRFFLRYHDKKAQADWSVDHPQGMRLTARQVKILRSTTYIETNNNKALTACAPEPYKEFAFFGPKGKIIGQLFVFGNGTLPEVSPMEFNLGDDQYFEVDLGRIDALVQELNGDAKGAC